MAKCNYEECRCRTGCCFWWNVYTLAKAPTAVTIDLTFNWGSHFKSKNPYNFYNKKTIGEKIDATEGQTKTWGDDANEFMTHFNAITEVNFTLKITVTRQ